MKRLVPYFSFLLLFPVLSSFTPVKKVVQPYVLKTLVIDAGHGGHDAGCKGLKSQEKDVALQIAMKFGNYVEEYFPTLNVIYTRKSDTFVELIDRANIANTAKADLFMSIHCNYNPNKSAFGTETFAMGLHVSEANLSVAKRENSVIELEENYKSNYDGFDPNSPESYILFSLFQNANLDKSLSLAAKVQHQFQYKVNRFNRGVKQAGFLVLYKTAMPSVLIETGFLSNREEEKFMNSEEGQTYLASAIFRAFKEYKNELEGEGK